MNYDWHWMYFPEPRYPFYRVSFPGNMAESTVPSGHASLIAEVAVNPGDVPDLDQLAEQVVEGLVTAGLLHRGELLDPLAVEVLDPAYVVYDHARADAVRTCHQFLRGHGIEPAGRFGQWAFFNMDHTILSGRRAARNILERER